MKATVRTWYLASISAGAVTHAGVDAIIREAIRQEGGQAGPVAAKPKIHRIVASMIHGSGAHSIYLAGAL